LRRLRRAGGTRSSSLCLLLALGAMGGSPGGSSQDDASSTTCFFCHMDIVIEMKINAAKHWAAKVRCESCHGRSIGHLDVEDNSIKPEKVWTDASVHGLCRKCHPGPFRKYASGRHGKGLEKNRGDQNARRYPSCSGCHGYHGQTPAAAIMAKCSSCHTSLPAARDVHRVGPR